MDQVWPSKGCHLLIFNTKAPRFPHKKKCECSQFNIRSWPVCSTFFSSTGKLDFIPVAKVDAILHNNTFEMQNIYDVSSHGWNHCEMLVLRNRIGELIVQTPLPTKTCFSFSSYSSKTALWFVDVSGDMSINIISVRAEKSTNYYYVCIDLLFFLEIGSDLYDWKTTTNHS